VVAIVRAVTGIEAGAYVYDPIEHALRRRSLLDPDRFHALVHRPAPEMPPLPAVTLAVVATFARSRVKYGLRGYRFVLIEVGHLAQNALLAATALGLHTVPWGGFVDADADRLLELDGIDRGCLYLIGLSATDSGPGGSSGTVDSGTVDSGTVDSGTVDSGTGTGTGTGTRGNRGPRAVQPDRAS
jgi:SagB-type dehydrogenase family enzyme